MPIPLAAPLSLSRGRHPRLGRAGRLLLHPPLIALTISGAALFGSGNPSPGEREDR
jgi:hypothetical protein